MPSDDVLSEQIELGEAKRILAGGMENMSQAPYVIRGARKGLKLGQSAMEDSLMVALLDTYCGYYMAQTSDNLARKYDISREQQDEYALRSQQCAGEAAKAGKFKDEIVPVTAGKKTITDDDHLRSCPLTEQAPQPVQPVIVAGSLQENGMDTHAGGSQCLQSIQFDSMQE